MPSTKTARSNALPQIWGGQTVFFIWGPCFGYDGGLSRTKRDHDRTMPEGHLGRAITTIETP